MTFVVKPGREEDVIGLFARLTEAARAEPGRWMDLAHHPTDDLGKFFLDERCDDGAAFDAHRASDHVARLVARRAA